MKNAMKRIMCMMIAVMLLISVVPAAFAAEDAETATLSIAVKINGVETNTRKTYTVTGEVNLTADFGMSFVTQNRENRSFAGWTKADGTAIPEGKAIRAKWLNDEAGDDYYVVLNITETESNGGGNSDNPIVTDKPITVPVNIYVNGKYMRQTSITVPVNGSVTLTKTLAMDLLKSQENRSCDSWSSTLTADATGNVLSYGWLKGIDLTSYALNINITEVDEDDTTDNTDDDDDTTVNTPTTSGTYYNGGYADMYVYQPKVVWLNIYLNGDVNTINKSVNISDTLAKDGMVTLGEVEEFVFTKYDAKTTSGIKFTGLYLETGNWLGNFAYANDRYDTIDGLLTERKYHTVNINVMIDNATATSSGTADTSNPKTGDNIMIAVTTMALAGAALVSVAELKKRKMI